MGLPTLKWALRYICDGGPVTYVARYEGSEEENRTLRETQYDPVEGINFVWGWGDSGAGRWELRDGALYLVGDDTWRYELRRAR